MFFRLRRILSNRQFALQCRGILHTAPIVCKPGRLTIVSIVSKQDLVLYLLGIKSLFSRIGEGQILLIDDGSLNAADHDLIRRHVQGIQILPIANIDTGPFPRGGTWERLVLIHELAKSNYVMQMDSDTLTVARPQEILDAIDANRSFLLGTMSGTRIAPVEECAAFARTMAPNDHIQVVCEQKLDDLKFQSGLKYVRASSGFAGFARGTCDVGLLESFSREMSAITGKRWTEWGTEQVASNFALANAPSSFVLPQPKYTCHVPTIPIAESAFLHFIGNHRFENGTYARLGRQFIREFDGGAIR